MPNKPKLTWIRCGWCGRLRQVEARRIKRGWGRFCGRNCASRWAINGKGHPVLGNSKAQTGPNNGNWRGGITIHSKGYIYEYAPDHPAQSNGYVLQHRLVAERKLGRYLRPEEVVHHKDGNKANNHPDNIEVFAGPGQHSAHHWKLRLATN